MPNRNKIIISLISLLIFSFTTSAQAISLSGTKCNKVKSVKIISNIKYVCVKSGNKLTWSKKSTIDIPLKTTPILVPSTTSKLELEIVPTSPAPEPVLTAMPKSKTYYELGYESLKDRLALKTNKSIINWYISDNASNRNHQKYINSLIYSAQLWSDYMHISDVSIVLFTEQDSDWIDAKQKELMGKYLNNPTEQLQSYRLKQWGCNIGGFYLPNIIVACVKNDTDRSAMFSASMLLSHEYVHIVGMTSMLLSTAPVGDSSRLRPCWVEEGLATYYGFFAAYILDPNFIEDRINFLTNIRTTVNRTSKESVVQTFHDIEQNMNTCSKVQDAYALGAIGFERLAYLYGHDKIYYFNKLFYTGMNWKQAFFNAFGLTTEEFYDTISNDVVSNIWNT